MKIIIGILVGFMVFVCAGFILLNMLEQEMKERDDEMMMKGYKGFKKGLICREKQYKENTIFEEEEAEICESGMHFCKNPLDVLDYYPLLDDDCNLSEFAEVEALDKALTDDDKKYCTKKLKIGAKLSLKNFINASIEFLQENLKENDGTQVATNNDYSKVAASGYDIQVATSGYNSKVATSGYYSQVATCGDNSQVATSDYGSKVATSGYYSQVATSGYNSRVATCGDYSQVAAGGDASQAVTCGDYSQIAINGDCSVGVNLGMYGKIKGKKGTWITLAEYHNGVCDCVRSAKIDGVELKEDVFYTLKNGKFVMVGENDDK